jgi:hypothetical protein
MQDKVTRLRQLMSEALPRPPSALAANEDAWRAYEVYSFNTAAPVEQAPRDLAARAINRIAMTYGWPHAVQQFLDAAQVPSISLLSNEQVDQLLERMRHLESCAQTGCDSDEAPPAR